MWQNGVTRPGAGAALRRGGGSGAGIQPGFSLIEILLVITITGIMMTFAAARVDWIAMEVNSASRQVSSTLLASQRLALLRQHAIVVAIDTAGNRVRIHEDRNNNGVIDANEPFRYVALEEAVTFGRGSAPVAPYNLGANTVSFRMKQDGMPGVAFYRGGNASESGIFYVTSKRAVRNAKYTRDTRALLINRPTGRTYYLTFDGASWRRGY